MGRRVREIVQWQRVLLPKAAHLCGVSYLAEGQNQSLTEVSDSRVRILGETVQPQGRSRCRLSMCRAEHSWHHWVPVLWLSSLGYGGILTEGLLFFSLCLLQAGSC